MYAVLLTNVLGSKIDKSISVPCGIKRNANNARRLMANSNHSPRKTNNKSLSIFSQWLANVFEDIAMNKMIIAGEEAWRFALSKYNAFD